jgi:tight adherence protein C
MPPMVPPAVIAVCAFASIVLMANAIFGRSRGRVHERLRIYGGEEESTVELSTPFSSRVIMPMVWTIARLVRSVSAQNFEHDVRLLLTQAGNPAGLDVTRFMALRGVGLVAPIVLLVGPRILSGDVDFKVLAEALVFAAVGWRSPTVWLNARISGRRKAITKGLPDALDLIIVCVEAGNSLEGSLAIVADKLTGPLAVEFARTLQEMSLGKMRSDALHDLAKRCASPDLQTFIAAVVQADQLGIGIAQVLRVQADAMRVKRRQRAEEAAAKVPVKMLLPLVLFILPALMVVIMGPVVLTVASFFTAHPTN